MSRSEPDVNALIAVAARAVGSAVQVEGLRRLSGGASRETWSFDGVAADGMRYPLVLRRDPGAHTGLSDLDAVRAHLRAAVREKLLIANPTYVVS